MAYEKTEWTARQGVNLNRFEKDQETARSVVLHNSPGAVTQGGTKFSAANMNKIEQGIYDAHEGLDALNTRVGRVENTGDISGKTDKVANAVNNNFAALDAGGNLKDSGKKPADFASAAQGAKADSAYQKPSSGIPKSDLAGAVQTAIESAVAGTTRASEADLLKMVNIQSGNLIFQGNWSFSSTGVLAKSGAEARVISIPVSKTQSTDGFIDWVSQDAVWPTITGLGTTPNIAGGGHSITIPIWTAIIGRHTKGGSQNAVALYALLYNQTNPTDFLQPGDIFLCVRAGNNPDKLLLGNGLVIGGGVSVVNGGIKISELDNKADKTTAYILNETEIDATGLDQDNFYPVTIPLKTTTRLRNHRIEVYANVDNSGAPAWKGLTVGFMVRKIWEVEGSGYGSVPDLGRRVLTSVFAYVSEGGDPVRSLYQIYQTSTEVVYVRGGGRYYFQCSHGIIPQLHPGGYAWSLSGSSGSAPVRHKSDAALTVIVPDSNYKADAASPVFTGTPKILDANGSQNKIAVVPDASAAAETSLPVGTYIFAIRSGNTVSAINATVGPCYVPAIVRYAVGGGDMPLAGVWKVSGSGTNGEEYLLRRVE